MSVLEAKESGIDTRCNQEDYSAQWVEALNSDLLLPVEQRVVRQLLQALIYEEVLPYEFRQESTFDSKGWFVLEGKTITGQSVQYHCRGSIRFSFGRICLDPVAILRISHSGQTQSATLQEILTEVIAHAPNTERLTSFVDELEQTLLKDLQAHHQKPLNHSWNQHLDYDELEGDIMDAHTYHPCYKSRIGFSLDDNERYGPEFKHPIQIHWLAVHHSTGTKNQSSSIDYCEFMEEQLGRQDYQRFTHILQQQGLNIDNYWLIPVHPWQWQEKVYATFYPELISKDIIYLGIGSDHYRAQQSIRTLANSSAKLKPSVKLPLSITNTSMPRMLGSHTIMNAAVITDWLRSLVSPDETAREMDFVFLGETLGITFDYHKLPEVRRTKAYGTLGVIWRDSLHRYLKPGEDGFPFNGLCSLKQSSPNTEKRHFGDSPLIDKWIQNHRIKPWTEQLLKVSISPIIHMLFAHGVALESHGQNIVLIHKNGWPVRIALKDLHGGIRYSPTYLSRPESSPELYFAPSSHAVINPNSFIQTEDLNAVRDLTCDAFFFICLAELGIFLEQHYQLDEATFWSMSANIILSYQADHPEHAERFKAFDVFAESYQVEELAKKRLFGDSPPKFRQVPNPLHNYRPEPSC